MSEHAEPEPVDHAQRDLRDLMASGVLQQPPDPTALERELAAWQPPPRPDVDPDDVVVVAVDPADVAEPIDPATVPTVGLASSVLCGGAAPARGGAVLTPYYCPVCRGGQEDSGCLYCERSGLVDGERVKGWPAAEVREAPRPPGVRRSPCGDCAFLEGSPELDADPDRRLFKPDAPFFCHQGMAEVAGQHQPAAWWAGLPLGYLLCAGWWDLFTRDKLHSRHYIELEEVRQRVAIEREDQGLPPLSAAEAAELEMRAQTERALEEVDVLADMMARAVVKVATPRDAQPLTPEQRDAVLEGIRAALRLNAVDVSVEQEPVAFDQPTQRWVLTVSWPSGAVRR